MHSKSFILTKITYIFKITGWHALSVQQLDITILVPSIMVNVTMMTLMDGTSHVLSAMGWWGYFEHFISLTSLLFYEYFLPFER